MAPSRGSQKIALKGADALEWSHSEADRLKISGDLRKLGVFLFRLTAYEPALLLMRPLSKVHSDPMFTSSEATVALLQKAIEALREAVAVFDHEQRFVAWNSRFAETAGEDREIHAGESFADHIRRCVWRGHIPAAVGCEEQWVAERLARFSQAEGMHRHQLATGSWVQDQDRMLPGGGRITIRSDVTALLPQEQSSQLLFDANPMPMLLFDRDTLAMLSVNDAALRFYGYSRPDFLRLSLDDVRIERHPGEVADALAVLDGTNVYTRLVRHRIASGDVRTVEVTGGLLRHHGRAAVLATVVDVTDREFMQQEVRNTWRFLQQLVDTIPVAVFAKDMRAGGRYVVFNRASEALFGCEARTLLGRSAADLFSPACIAKIAAHDEAAMRLGSDDALEEEAVMQVNGQARVIRTRKVALTDVPGAPPRFVLGVAEDMTEQRADAALIAHRAHHDALTDLPNRLLFESRFAGALMRARQSEELLALLFLDLDGFKPVNDAWGHAAGDLLLKAVAGRLRGMARSTDTVARFGGDEFAFLQVPLTQASDAERLAARVIAAMAPPFSVRNHPLTIGISVGIALAPTHGVEMGALFERADAALYRAKRAGRGRYRLAA